MWQVYLYLANEHQVRERDARARDGGRRWRLGRRSQDNSARPKAAAPRTTASPSSRAN
jgi:hypothetical protein